MELCYETDRLQLRLLDETWAERVLQFYLNGKEVFEAREPDRPTNFYTSDYQTALLHYESQMTLKMAAVRFWMFEKENPERIIGTISFQNILRSVYQSCQIGYKLDPHYWHHGYAREAVARTLSIVLSEFDLHRVEALVNPDNQPSIRLLEQVGFEAEGLCRSCIYLHSRWVDHLRYSYIPPACLL